MRMHPIFYISLLEPALNDTIVITPRLDIKVHEEEYEVERIYEKWRTNGKIEYLVKWKNYGEEDNTWELAKNLKNASAALRRFHMITQPR